jgi:hypothetical protein
MAGWTNLTPSGGALAAGNAYLHEDAGALKYQGTSGSIATIVNADGTMASGVQGTTGLQGTTGTQGLTGLQGTTGIQGLTGAQGIQGTTGVQGLQGNKGGLQYRYTTYAQYVINDSTVNPGEVAPNAATNATTTQIIISSVDRLGASYRDFIGEFQNSTTLANRGYVTIKSNVNSVATYAVFRITSSFGENSDGTPFWVIPVSFVSGSGTFAADDNLSVEFSRTGDIGATGASVGSMGGYESGQYYGAFHDANASNAAATEDLTYYHAFYVSETTTFDRIACRTGATFSGTATVRLGIYNNGTNVPTTVALDAGTVSCTATNTLYAITISQSLTPGWYWLAFNSQTNATTNNFTFMSPTVSWGYMLTATNYNRTPCRSESGITGAFATAGTLSTSGPVSVPGILLRAV